MSLLQRRSKETIRTLFAKIGYKIPDDDFEKLWKQGLDHDKDCSAVCIDTFYNLMKEYAPIEIRKTATSREC